MIAVILPRAVLPIRSNHPAAACGSGFPSLSKEGILIAEFRDRNVVNGSPLMPNWDADLYLKFAGERTQPCR